MIADVPTVAIDLIEVLENSSVLCDEFLAHRLGLVPLDSTKASELFKPYEYAGNDDSATDVHLELNVRCVGEQTRDVTSEDLVSYDKRVKPVSFHDASTGAWKSNAILIAKLRKNQEISMKCIARKGTGKDHAKWSPVATAVFKHEPMVRVDQEILSTLTGHEKSIIVESDPSKMFKYDAEIGSLTQSSFDVCTFDKEILNKATELGKDGLIEIRPSKENFIFHVESTGALKVEEIVLQALQILHSKLDIVSGELDALETLTIL